MCKRYTEILVKRLKHERYVHSLGVAFYAADLARIYGADVEKAKVAGLLHDYARDMPEEELLAWGEKGGLIGCEVERKLPVLLHGPVAAYLLPKELGLDDPEILQAIARHTVGARDMTLLDKIIYLADALEPNRSFPGVESLRKLAFEDLDRALLKALDSSITYVLQKRQLLHPATVEARNFLLLLPTQPQP